MSEGQPNNDALNLGLLMEAAQAQQRLGADAIAQLGEHVRALDGVVRHQVTRAVLEALADVRAQADQAADALRSLRRASGLRWTLSSVVTVVLSLTIVLVVVRLEVPSRSQIAALRARRALFAADVRRLREYGGAVDLRRCGVHGKLCVRVRRNGPTFGPHGEFLLVKAP